MYRRWRCKNKPYRRAVRLKPDTAVTFKPNQPKPQWVIDEIIRIRAQLPFNGYGSGARAVADIFNRRHAGDKNPQSVCKSTVAKYLRLNTYKVIHLRRKLKHRIPRSEPCNARWGVDLTGRQDSSGNTHQVFGIIDYGSRASLCLERVNSKHTIRLLIILLKTIERHGKPKAIHTDNEAVFISWTFTAALKLLGIRHKRSEPGCPWQNGRIERLFGTLKDKLKQVVLEDAGQLDELLGSFRFWNNHVRPHQHLAARTPAEVWNGTTHLNKYRVDFIAWSGLLTGDLYLE